MTLTSGTRLGVYEVSAKIGQGGMGEVYQARDTKLDRDVALKVLPEAFTADPERLGRFEREAKVLASLNHPNIGAIYGLEEADGVKALVLELIEGPTLADRIEQGPIPIDDARPIARQIAEALGAAHEAGVMHRDLKPANIKVREDGTVKVLDFGLAKALTGDVPAADLSLSPTLTMQATQAGVILGTAAYMSPEQARGRVTDSRTDVWAFGAVLFEMLSGRGAFGGEDLTLTLAAVVKEEPDWTLLPTEARPLRSILARCLTKDPRQRFHHIADVGFAIEECLAAPPSADEVGASAGRPSVTGRHVLGMAAALLAVVALTVLAMRALTPDAPPPRMVQSSVLPPDGAAFVGRRAQSIALSPDGRFLAFVARSADGERALWLRSLDSVTAQRLEGTRNAEGPFWSPDSRSIGFFDDEELKAIDVSGEAVQILVPSSQALARRGGAWNQDGVVLFPHLDRTIHRLMPDGGGSLPVTTLAGEDSVHSQPAFLPDGIHFLYVASSYGGAFDGRVYLGSLDGMEPDFLLNATRPTYVAPGYLLFARDGTLRAQRFDDASMRLRGEAYPVAGNASVDGGYSASATGVLAYHTGAIDSFSRLWWHDRSGRQIEPVGEPGNYFFPRLSRDDRQLAVDLSDENNDGDLWLYRDLSRPVPTRFTIRQEDGSATLPVWSPDDSQIVFGTFRGPGTNDLYLKSTTVDGEAELLLSEEGNVQPTDWSRDGRLVLFNRRGDVWMFSMQDRKVSPLLDGPFTESHARFSPDGRRITYVSDETGAPEIYVRPFPGPGVSIRISEGGGSMPMWSDRGDELFFVAPDRTLMSVDTPLGPQEDIGLPRRLFATGIRGATVQPPQYDVSSDGLRFLINTLVDPDGAFSLTLVTNWPALLPASTPDNE